MSDTKYDCQNIVDLFNLRVAEGRDDVAVTFLGEHTTYGELGDLSDRVAVFLRACGVQAEEPVGVFMDRGLRAVATIIGTVKAGAAYVPLDTSSPADRLRLVAGESDIGRILVDSPARVDEVRKFCRATAEVTVFDDLPPAGPEDSARGRGAAISPLQLAYVIYTSGSTGTPKGVGISHGDLVAFTQDPCWSGGLDEAVLHNTPLNFDASVFEMWMPLLRGGRLVIAPQGSPDAHALGRLVADEQVSSAFITPSLFNLLVEEHVDVFAGIRRVWVGGEAASPSFVHRGVQAWGPGSVANAYGPTEVTVFATYHVVPDELGTTVPIGRPMADVRAYVLDEDLRPVEPGQTGELCLAGRGVARGYRGRPALTAERFVPDPFAGDGTRMYRTGDMARCTEDGLLDFVGRQDRQVKVRGFRIELQEIENSLTGHDDVAAAAVVTHKDRHGDNVLHAYLVRRRTSPASDEQAEPVWARRVLEELRASLPSHMVPAAATVLDHLPLNQNGKLDVPALPTPVHVGEEGLPGTAGAAGTVIEGRLCRIFAEILGRDAFGVHDDFFLHGGHSLLAVRAARRVESAFGVRIGVNDLLDAPTVRQLAKRLEPAAGDEVGRGVPLTPQSHSGPTPLSTPQRRLWFLDRAGVSDSAVYHIPVVYRISRDVDPSTLRSALQDVVARHESLRTTFPAGLDEPHQRVLDAGDWDLDVTVVDCPQDALEAELVTASRVPFDLGHELPIRAWLFRTGAVHVLLLVVHHISADGWSLTPLSRDLGKAYAARAAGQEPQFAPLPVQYRDFTVWQRESPALEEHLRYWSTRLDGIPDELTLPTDRPRPAVASNAGGLVEFELPADLCRGLDRLAREAGTSLFAVLQAGLAALLTRLRAGEDIVVGSPIAGRSDSALDDLVGFFVSTVVLRTDTSGNPTFRELLSRVQEGWQSAYAHHDVPFDLLVERLNPPRSLARHPVFQVSLALLNTPGIDRNVEGLEARWKVGSSGTAKFDLDFALTPQVTGDGGQEGLDGAVEYATDLFDGGTVRRMVTRFIMLLRDAAEHPDRRLGALRIMDDAERRELLADDGVRADRRTIVEHFRARVSQHPNKVAVTAEGRGLSYRELDGRSEAVARYVAARRGGPEACLALLMSHSVDEVCVLVGVLKAGAAYVPLDPRFPAARMRTMLTDCDVRTVFVDTPERADLVRGFAGDDVEVVLIDTASLESDTMSRESDRWGAGAVPEPEPPVDPGQLACVMFTSGSTGQPKGVAVTHRDILGIIHDARWSDAAVERVALHSALAFDASTFEVWAPLVRGGCIVVTPPDVDNVAALRRVLIEENVSMALMTTALFNLMVQQHPEVFARLTKVLVGGETASPAAFERALELSPADAIVHVYGPTETTTFSTCRTVDRVEATTVSLGGPMDGVRVYLLDQFGELVGAGMTGEMCVGGVGVTRGYVRQPGRTAERFVPDPFGPPGSRMYRTGDLFRRRDNGELEFSGRLDRQVKIRGFRIEPSEIEAVLADLPEVGQAFVMVREDSAVGKTLAAYVVPAPGHAADRDALPARLRRAVGERVPDYMVPTAFVVLDHLPMTTSNKVDWRALPVPAVENGARMPQTSEERVLSGLFADVLGQATVGADDNFFERGGHSLLSVRLIDRLRADHGIEVSVRALFASPTPAGLAAVLSDDDRKRLTERPDEV